MFAKLNTVRTWIFGALLIALVGRSEAKTPPQFLTDAETLVGYLQQAEVTSPNCNVYGLPAFINWNGANSSARTECSSFVTNLWEHTFGWTSATFNLWMGSNSPDAAMYHDTIALHKGFTQLLTINQIQPGDIIAIVYYPEYQSPSGHVMIVDGLPQPNNTNPLIANTTQWTVAVIDSTTTFHGTTDTRYTHPGGIGKGIFRLYANPDGTIAGYTWSLLSTSVSKYVPQSPNKLTGNHLVIGRLAQ